MPQAPDYSAWFTKQQAAEAIGCSTKLIEQFAKEKKIQTAKWKKPQTGARIAVYHPGDVKRMRKARNPGAEPFIMPASDASETSRGLRPAGGDIIRLPALFGELSEPMTNSAGILAKALEAIGAQIASQNSENRREWPVPLFLTTKEAVRYTGLSAGYLDSLVKSGSLSRLKGMQGHRYRKADLDRLGESAPVSAAFGIR